MKDFKKFLLRGNVVDLAVGVTVGVAFSAVVTSFVTAFLTPIVALVADKSSLASLSFTVGDDPGAVFPYGAFLNALISFTLIATAVFFLVVKPVNTLNARREARELVDEPMRECPECLSSIRMAASRCAFCTSDVIPAT